MNKKNYNRIDFDTALDECLERVMKGEDLQNVLARYPQYARELEPLLRTALDTRGAIASARPRPEFRQRAAVEFQKAIQRMPAKSGGFRWRAAWAAPLATLAVVLIAGSGTVAAASSSLPGSPLYSVKLATETVQIALTPSALGKAELYSKFNDRRVDELVQMADKGMAAEINALNTRMEEQMNAMSELTGGTASAAGVNDKTVMMAPAATAPPEHDTLTSETDQGPSAKAPQMATAVPSPTSTLRPTIAAGPETTVAPTTTPAPAPAATTTTAIAPPAEERGLFNINRAGDNDQGNQDNRGRNDKQDRLQKTLTEKQQKNLERLQAALERAPEDMKPEIQRSIDIILYGYDTSISNLSDR